MGLIIYKKKGLKVNKKFFSLIDDVADQCIGGWSIAVRPRAGEEILITKSLLGGNTINRAISNAGINKNDEAVIFMSQRNDGNKDYFRNDEAMIPPFKVGSTNETINTKVNDKVRYTTLLWPEYKLPNMDYATFVKNYLYEKRHVDDLLAECHYMKEKVRPMGFVSLWILNSFMFDRLGTYWHRDDIQYSKPILEKNKADYDSAASQANTSDYFGYNHHSGTRNNTSYTKTDDEEKYKDDKNVILLESRKVIQTFKEINNEE